MKAPKCKTCGVEEWKHTCGDVAKAVDAVGLNPSEKSHAGSIPAVPTIEIVKGLFAQLTPEQQASVLAHTGDDHLDDANGSFPKVSEKTDRKEYLKLKARERRARDSEAAKRLGMSVREYRERNAP